MAHPPDLPETQANLTTSGTLYATNPDWVEYRKQAVNSV